MYLKGKGFFYRKRRKPHRKRKYNIIRTTRVSPYERNRASVYATGNKWAIENWNATHN